MRTGRPACPVRPFPVRPSGEPKIRSPEPVQTLTLSLNPWPLRFRDKELDLRVEMNFISAFKGFVLVYGTAHWLGCLFYFMSRLQARCRSAAARSLSAAMRLSFCRRLLPVCSLSQPFAAIRNPLPPIIHPCASTCSRSQPFAASDTNRPAGSNPTWEPETRPGTGRRPVLHDVPGPVHQHQNLGVRLPAVLHSV